MTEIELPTSVGGEYLCRLREKAARHRERQTKARALSVQVNKLFHPLEEEVSCRKNDSGGMLIDIAHLIDEKAVEPVRTWKFKPAIRNGSPVPVRASVEVTFRLF